tara:strand:- start:767 stop:1126 length:360 start_codon:yes stop_codon:yes gene_type:complete
MDLKQIIYINQNKFVGQLVEKVCKQEDVKCYTLSQNEDFTYLINDLLPEAIIITQDAFNEFGEDALKCIEAGDHKSRLVLMTNNSDIDSRFDFKLNEELNPQTFLQDVINLLGEYNKKH